jgi:hypothetical protein
MEGRTKTPYPKYTMTPTSENKNAASSTIVSMRHLMVLVPATALRLYESPVGKELSEGGRRTLILAPLLL